jgi:MFS family permease
MASVSQIGCELGVARAASTAKPEARGGGAALAASSAGCCLVFVSGSVINVALASIGRDLGLSAAELQWILNAELLPLAALTLVGGALGDRYGHKQVFLLGITLFLFASLGCGLASTWTALVTARLGLGVGEALILPTGLSILGQTFTPDRKGRAVGIWSASAAVASAVAPAIAGLALDHGSWRAAFLMQVPLAGVAFVLAEVWTPAAPPRPDAVIDLAAGGLSVVGLGALGWSLMALTNGADDPLALAVGVFVAIVAFTSLVGLETRRGDRAMLPPTLFASRTVVALSIFTGFLYGAFTTTLTLVPFVMIKGAHLSALVAGVAFIPLQILVTGVSPFAGPLCARFGHSLPLAVGALVTGLGCAAALKIGSGANYWSDIFPAVGLVAIGMSLVLAPMTTLVLTSVDGLHAATASGFNGAVSRAGSLAAIALLSGVLQRSGEDLIRGFHAAMMVSAAACLAAALAAFSIATTREPDPAFGL